MKNFVKEKWGVLEAVFQIVVCVTAPLAYMAVSYASA
jgi:hypothetical protein